MRDIICRFACWFGFHEWSKWEVQYARWYHRVCLRPNCLAWQGEWRNE